MSKRFIRAFLLLGLIAALPLALATTVKSTVVAEVNGQPITQSDLNLQFNLFIQNLAAQRGVQLTPEIQKRFELLKPQFLGRMVEDLVVAQQAAKEGLIPRAKVMDARIKQVEGQFKDTQAFEKALKKAGIPNLTVYRALVRQSMTYTSFMNRLFAKMQVSVPAMRALYYLSQNRFRRPAELCVSHILVKTDKEAKTLLVDLKNGASFAKLAKEYSQDPGSKDQGGSLGCQPYGTFAAPFEAAARVLTVGRITPRPVKTRFGYHIIRLDAKKPAAVEPFAQVEPQIEKQIKSEAVRDYVASLKARASIKILLQTPSQPLPAGKAHVAPKKGAATASPSATPKGK